MSYTTNPIANRLKITTGWTQSEFISNDYQRTREQIKGFKLFLLIKNFLKYKSWHLLEWRQTTTRHVPFFYITALRLRKPIRHFSVALRGRRKKFKLISKKYTQLLKKALLFTKNSSWVRQHYRNRRNQFRRFTKPRLKKIANNFFFNLAENNNYNVYRNKSSSTYDKAIIKNVFRKSIVTRLKENGEQTSALTVATSNHFFPKLTDQYFNLYLTKLKYDLNITYFFKNRISIRQTILKLRKLYRLYGFHWFKRRNWKKMDLSPFKVVDYTSKNKQKMKKKGKTPRTRKGKKFGRNKKKITVFLNRRWFKKIQTRSLLQSYVITRAFTRLANLGLTTKHLRAVPYNITSNFYKTNLWQGLVKDLLNKAIGSCWKNTIIKKFKTRVQQVYLIKKFLVIKPKVSIQKKSIKRLYKYLSRRINVLKKKKPTKRKHHYIDKYKVVSIKRRIKKKRGRSKLFHKKIIIRYSKKKVLKQFGTLHKTKLKKSINKFTRRIFFLWYNQYLTLRMKHNIFVKKFILPIEKEKRKTKPFFRKLVLERKYITRAMWRHPSLQHLPYWKRRKKQTVKLALRVRRELRKKKIIKKLKLNNFRFNYLFKRLFCTELKLNFAIVKFMQPLRFLLSLKKMRAIAAKKRDLFRYKRLKMYPRLLPLVFLLGRYWRPQPLVNQIAFEFTKTKKHWFILKGVRTLIQRLRPFIFSGYRIAVRGKIDSRDRTRVGYIKYGRMPRQTFATRISYSFCQSDARTGSFGIRAWFFVP